jgi:hypothetical protein
LISHPARTGGARKLNVKSAQAGNYPAGAGVVNDSPLLAMMAAGALFGAHRGLRL